MRIRISRCAPVLSRAANPFRLSQEVYTFSPGSALASPIPPRCTAIIMKGSKRDGDPNGETSLIYPGCHHGADPQHCPQAAPTHYQRVADDHAAGRTSSMFIVSHSCLLSQKRAPQVFDISRAEFLPLTKSAAQNPSLSNPKPRT